METLTPIIDSAMTLEEALVGLETPQEIRNTLTLITVQYISFEDSLHQGQIILNKNVAEEVQNIFREICHLRFPIQHAIPIVKYGWNDDASMEANNTSAFNYRVIHGTNKLSNHSYGLAIDINPLINPYVARDGSLLPGNATHDSSAPGTLSGRENVVQLFLSRGWKWGGNWNPPDWQHFEKIEG